MRFLPNQPIDNNKAQRIFWSQVQRAFTSDEGVAYYRYPIFQGRGSKRREPDVLLVHRELGVWTFEVKGCGIANVAEINGHEWRMRDWHSEFEHPVAQVEAQHFEVKALIERERELRALRLVFEYRVVLPLISAGAWAQQGFSRHPNCDGVVFVEEDLEPAALRSHLRDSARAGRMPVMSDHQWQLLLGALRGRVSDGEPRSIPTTSPTTSPARAIREVERAVQFLDAQQDRIASEVPEGPQRIRGLAGTGKTVLLARRAAYMHASHPDWEIAFCFWTQSLYDQVTKLIEERHRALTQEAPNWQKLHVMHAWGNTQRMGFYRKMAKRAAVRPLSLNDLRKRIGDAAFKEGFAVACDELDAHTSQSPSEPFLDAVLIDEGQDLPASYYRLAYKALKAPKRLYWAYDEAQGIDSLIVPRASEIFGRGADGAPVVELGGRYPSGILRAHNMKRCYRTPQSLLVVAHAVNMGLLRKGGALQGVTTADEWRDLGYEVEEGDFSNASVSLKRRVSLVRDPAQSGHPIDQSGSSIGLDHGKCFSLVPVGDEDEQASRVAQSVKLDLDAGLSPDDLLVVVLARDSATSSLQRHRAALRAVGIPAVIAGEDTAPDQFRAPGQVTLSQIHRAKGNEAWKVYACNLHIADAHRVKDTDEELRLRNRVLVALTRARMWCVGLGLKGPIMDELAAAQAVAPRLQFPALNRSSLRRVTNHAEQPGLFD